jgi:hypothetical protein
MPSLSQSLAQQSMLSGMGMGMAGLPYGYPTMYTVPNYLTGGLGLAGSAGMGMGAFGGMGAMNYDAASRLLASRRVGEAMTSDALAMLELAKRPQNGSDDK